MLHTQPSPCDMEKMITRFQVVYRKLLTEFSLSKPKNDLLAEQRMLYLLFAEGYLSSQSGTAIRLDLCKEAPHLTALLSESELGDMPETQAFHWHAV